MPSTAAKRKRSDDPATVNGDGNPTLKKHFPNPPTAAATDEEKKKWNGFCEIENEPSIFNVMLREFGVRDVKVQEIFGLDEELLAMLPQPVHGLIFLSHYKDDLNTTSQEQTCPQHIWFANQTHDNACATVSLLNIINNIPRADLGSDLLSFKDFTSDFPPALRGDAIGNFDVFKRVHNSFARKMDMLNIDLGMKNKFDERNKKKTQQEQPAPTKRTLAKSKSKNSDRKKGQRKQRRITTPDPSDEEDDDTAFHFIAYVPIDGFVWKLDGLDRQPQRLGAIPDGTDWLDVITPVVQDRIATYAAGQIHFGLLGVVRDPMAEHLRGLGSNIKALRAVEGRLDEVKADWRDDNANSANGVSAEAESDLMRGPDEKLGLTQATIDMAEKPNLLEHRLGTSCMVALTKLREELVSKQPMLRGQVKEEQQSQDDDERRAREARFDYGPLIRTWLEMLAEKEGLMQELIKDVEMR